MKKSLIKTIFMNHNESLNFDMLKLSCSNIHIASYEYKNYNIGQLIDFSFRRENEEPMNILYILTEYNSVKEIYDEMEESINIIKPINCINSKFLYNGISGHIKFMSYMTISSKDLIKIIETNKSVYVPNIIIIDRSKYIFPHIDYQNTFSELNDICEKYGCRIVIRHRLKEGVSLFDDRTTIKLTDSFLHQAQLYNSTMVLSS